jgi:lysophospholipase L1-like esterase
LSRKIIVMLGASLIEGGDFDGICPEALVINEGLSGDTTMSLQGRLSDALRHGPDLIFVQAGLNDLAQGQPPRSLAERLSAIWQGLAGRGRAVRPISLAPLDETLLEAGHPFLKNALVREANGLIGEEAYKEGLPLLDIYGPLSDSEGQLAKGLSLDGVHLTPEGYSIWQDVLRTWLRESERLPDNGAD